MDRTLVPITGETLASLRERLGIGQSALAQRMGVSRQRVNNLEGQLRITTEAASKHVSALETCAAEASSAAEADA